MHHTKLHHFQFALPRRFMFVVLSLLTIDLSLHAYSDEYLFYE